MTDKVEEQILVNQAIIMSGIDTLVCANSGITPAIKKMLHEAFDDAISQVWNTVNEASMEHS